MHSLLFLLAQAFQAKPMRPLNEGLRLVLAPTLPSLLRLLLGGQWVLRNSLTEPGNYNPFFSDVDMALIVSDHEQNDRFVAEKLHRYFQLKRWLLMLGEIEVYSANEWAQKQRILRDHADLIPYSRSLRKLNWMNADFQNRPSRYHRAKAQRAIEKCRRTLAAKEKKFQNLASRIFPAGIPAFAKGRIDFYETDVDPLLTINSEIFFKMVTGVNYKAIPLPKNSWLAFRSPVLQMEHLEFRAYRRFAEKRWTIQSEWLDTIQAELQNS